MLRLLPRPSDSPEPAAGVPSVHAAEPVIARLFAEGRLTAAEAETLRRATPATLRCDGAYERIVLLDPARKDENIALVARVRDGLDSSRWLTRHLGALQHQALLRLPDFGARYLYVRAILVTLLVHP